MTNKQVYLITNEDFENVFNVFKNLLVDYGFAVVGATLPKVDEPAYIRLKSIKILKETEIVLQLCNSDDSVNYAYFNIYIDRYKRDAIKENYTVYRLKLNDKDIEYAFELTRDYLSR